jgi:hypothetical protein
MDTVHTNPDLNVEEQAVEALQSVNYDTMKTDYPVDLNESQQDYTNALEANKKVTFTINYKDYKKSTESK